MNPPGQNTRGPQKDKISEGVKRHLLEGGSKASPPTGVKITPDSVEIKIAAQLLKLTGVRFN